MAPCRSAFAATLQCRAAQVLLLLGADHVTPVSTCVPLHFTCGPFQKLVMHVPAGHTHILFCRLAPLWQKRKAASGVCAQAALPEMLANPGSGFEWLTWVLGVPLQRLQMAFKW